MLKARTNVISALAVLVAAPVTAVKDIQHTYMQHLALYGRNFPTVKEFNDRLAAFAATDEELRAITETAVNFKVSHNQFSDWTEAELARMLGQVPEIDSSAST